MRIHTYLYKDTKICGKCIMQTQSLKHFMYVHDSDSHTQTRDECIMQTQKPKHVIYIYIYTYIHNSDSYIQRRDECIMQTQKLKHVIYIYIHMTQTHTYREGMNASCRLRNNDIMLYTLIQIQINQHVICTWFTLRHKKVSYVHDSDSDIDVICTRHSDSDIEISRVRYSDSDIEISRVRYSDSDLEILCMHRSDSDIEVIIMLFVDTHQ